MIYKRGVDSLDIYGFVWKVFEEVIKVVKEFGFYGVG